MTTVGVRRLTGLTRANAVLMLRNRLTMSYALFVPLLPLALLITGPRGDTELGMTIAGTVLVLAMLFPVYYNVLSIVVTRRDELVLKRLRTGEARDGELLLAMALPGAVAAGLVAALSVGVGVALGQPFPLNPVLYAATVALAATTFAALALWTAAWTRNAEAAQLTSLPVIVLTMVGTQVTSMPASIRPFVDFTPGAALDRLLRISWFGQGYGGPVGLATSWTEAFLPVMVLAVWISVALDLARRSMRWEPRS